ncbi:mannose-6-phosphate isomerase-like protein (cupin superfamily) [Paenibacillus rhizosphaerae]|jgi:mannose-6-phosphate isomerase-like protein (cupin superfamily)|uniref:Mannose-6-phosphate isomerase-like protein (Cupin superfamily) n=1 Tax=Paenibacillus rhizosphaerae TaxID=297318 RepID=A0A839TPS3_9BACL|nr:MULTISPECIES: cupin domain-containing protein [Paenibacillus]MBB3128722.1 mannose-6-phosphate isomerase-like protein (cupin superfamily) [Paenibacillus rhizosphaerae]
MNGNHFSVLESGPISNLLSMSKDPIPGKLFLKDKLGLTGMEVSLNQLPEGGSVPFYHTHRENEELYLFIGGQGQFQVDGQIVDVKEGTAIRVSPEGERTLRNNGTGDLNFIVIQVQAGSLRQWVQTDGVILDKPVTWQV